MNFLTRRDCSCSSLRLIDIVIILFILFTMVEGRVSLLSCQIIPKFSSFIRSSFVSVGHFLQYKLGCGFSDLKRATAKYALSFICAISEIILISFVTKAISAFVYYNAFHLLVGPSQ